ncbi:hypothetical protein [Xylophilus ampelinus]|uniref:Uncharacterized protein n=1 Tax=Xylophilus ampelinus TaxID=54067 RepID=A0A318SEI7_9BURK|nr:hypothetical protein [Xylophilus ampelinus]MCS4510890.1 hypothetical protein [Xylophilus ampelinus]PYE76047.1 hypothetical protein DFQ15_1167 [Xylophilus ampelinus]
MSHSHSNIHARERRAQALALWGWPVVMGLLSIFGLLAALVYDGWGDTVSSIALAVPVLVIVWFGWVRKPARQDGDD